MSNLKAESTYCTTDFMKKDLMTNDTAAIKTEYDKGCSGLADKSKSYHKDTDHSCFYNTSASVPKTILITNNYSQDDPSGLSSHQNIQKSSSITIVTHNSDGERSTSNIPTSANSSTVVLDRINICINNHFNDPRSATSPPLIKPEPAAPPVYVAAESLKTKEESSDDHVSSSTSNHLADEEEEEESSMMSEKLEVNVPTFTTGEDVLFRRKDGRFYLGTIIAVARDRCLLRLDDNSEDWCPFEDITKLSKSDGSDSPMCVVCKKVNEKEVVEVCEKCGRGYHQRCTDGSFQKNGDWFCRRCAARNGTRLRTLQPLRIESLNEVLTDKSQLPYDIDSLTWDSHHRVNMEQIYCYCGSNGEWHKKMLQCCKCQQWFHEKCVRCLKYPLYRGDRFYVFVCSMCNHGTEFLRRLVMKWIDVVHLLLFNITSYNLQKYYHANKVIVPYAIDNWPFLNLDPTMRNLSASEIRENVLTTLSCNSPCFKCGREIKKQQSVWGLRNRIPPLAPMVIMPLDADINEQYLRQKTKLHFISVEYVPANNIFRTPSSNSSSILRSPTVIPSDIELKMSGCEYMGENSDNEYTDAKFTSDDELPLKVSIEREKQREMEKIVDVTRDILQKEDPAAGRLSREMSPILIPEEDFIGNDHTSATTTDSSDKSRDCPEYNGAGDDADVEMKDEETLDGTLARAKRSRKRKSPFLSSVVASCVDSAATKKHSEIIDICDSSDDTSSRGTLDLIIPPPKNFQGRNNPFRLTPKKNDNSTQSRSSLVGSKGAIGSSGVGGGARGGSSSSSASSSNNNLKTGNKPVLNTKVFGNVDLNQVAGQFRIVRTVKRRLSAKDIMIGPNMEVKRRRMRRRSGNVEVISTTTIQTLPKSAIYLPMRSDNKEWPMSAIRTTIGSSSSSTTTTPNATSPTNLGSLANVFNGRRLRQRREKNYAESSRRNSNTGLNVSSNTATSVTTPNLSLPGSPNKSGGGGGGSGAANQGDVVSLSDLKSSVNMYFGAANRIANGENFVVRAKRYLPNGKMQYLIEWDGIS